MSKKNKERRIRNKERKEAEKLVLSVSVKDGIGVGEKLG